MANRFPLVLNTSSTGEFNVDSSNYNNNMILMEVAG